MLSPRYWLTIEKEVRDELVDIFSIPRSRGSETENTSGVWKVVSDGHTSQDLTAINIETLQKYLTTESTDFFKMLDAAVSKIKKGKK